MIIFLCVDYRSDRLQAQDYSARQSRSCAKLVSTFLFPNIRPECWTTEIYNFLKLCDVTEHLLSLIRCWQEALVAIPIWWFLRRTMVCKIRSKISMSYSCARAVPLLDLWKMRGLLRRVADIQKCFEFTGKTTSIVQENAPVRAVKSSTTAAVRGEGFKKNLESIARIARERSVSSMNTINSRSLLPVWFCDFHLVLAPKVCERKLIAALRAFPILRINWTITVHAFRVHGDHDDSHQSLWNMIHDFPPLIMRNFVFRVPKWWSTVRILIRRSGDGRICFTGDAKFLCVGSTECGWGRVPYKAFSIVQEKQLEYHFCKVSRNFRATCSYSPPACYDRAFRFVSIMRGLNVQETW